MTGTWLPPEQYVTTIANATGYAALYFTDTAGRPLQLRAAGDACTWQRSGGEEWERTMRPESFARLRVTDTARRTGAVAYLEW